MQCGRVFLTGNLLCQRHFRVKNVNGLNKLPEISNAIALKIKEIKYPISEKVLLVAVPKEC
jgi:hypothetical protein